MTTQDADTQRGHVDANDVLDFAQRQVRNLINKYPDQTPVYTKEGAWQIEGDPWAPSWTAGFVTGLIWMMADRTQDDWWRTQAERYCDIVEPRKHDEGTHDIGFLFTPSWGRWHERSPSDRTVEVLQTAGRTMAKRLQPAGGYLSTWVDPGSTFIDVMMNVAIIFQAAQLTGDDQLEQVARSHCDTTLRYLVRGDGSTLHEGWFDTSTGEFQRAATHQGWRNDSSWARGQSWAIYGFGDAFRYTDDLRYLDAARRCADFYINRTPDHGVTQNDWEDPTPEQPYETSAACIAAAGMLRLADLVNDAGRDTDGAKYRDYGNRILATLCTPDFLAIDTPGWEGIIKHATYHRANNVGVDESIMWGEHYFVEALTHSLRSEKTT